jgi:hypothetical protein
MRSAAPAAWSTRKPISATALMARPHRPDARVNSATPTRNSFCRPYRSASRPAGTSSVPSTIVCVEHPRELGIRRAANEDSMLRHATNRMVVSSRTRNTATLRSAKVGQGFAVVGSWLDSRAMLRPARSAASAAVDADLPSTPSPAVRLRTVSTTMRDRSVSSWDKHHRAESRRHHPACTSPRSLATSVTRHGLHLPPVLMPLAPALLPGVSPRHPADRQRPPGQQLHGRADLQQRTSSPTCEFRPGEATSPRCTASHATDAPSEACDGRPHIPPTPADVPRRRHAAVASPGRQPSVERTLRRFNYDRRVSPDHARLPTTREAVIRGTMIHGMVRCMAQMAPYSIHASKP